MEDYKMRARAQEILKRIIPWAIETNVHNPQYRNNYKGVRGRVGIVGGARDYAGAPYFASISTMRLGADLAYVICSSSASQAIKNYSPDLIVMPILDCPNEAEFDNEMKCLLARLHALVIGPGLGRDGLLQSRARKLITAARELSLPLILDADSLILINENPTILATPSNDLEKTCPKVILTPNRVELQRMLNTLNSPKNYELRNVENSEIVELVKQCSASLGVTILSKGPVDICCDPSGFTLTTDIMTGSNRRCGGQGDILAGLAGVYYNWIEQVNKKDKDQIEYPAAWAAYLASATTRLSNELAFSEYQQGTLASHMIEKLHVALDKQLNEQVTNVNPISRVGLKPDDIYSGKLSTDEIKRYARQMIMEEFGPERQIRLKEASVIIIGAGGLGCPSAVYLGAGGIGRIGIVDDDRVEASNLHRQILHNLNKVGMLKTESIKEAILAINPNVRVDTHSVRMTRHNAVELIQDYDIVLDATDNLTARYMISDACVVAKMPLVSGAALKMDGQLTVYNYDEETPCFRCLFPEPPPASAVGSCSDNGVLGVIPGVIGVQQALEALKIAAGLPPAYARRMLIFDGQRGQYRHIVLGKRKPDCAACGNGSELDRNLIDYEKFCGTISCKGAETKAVNILEPNERISVEEYLDIMRRGEPHVIVDVRPMEQSNVSRFKRALQLPVQKMMTDSEDAREQLLAAIGPHKPICVYVVCRRGIASQRGARIIQELLKDIDNVCVKDIIGGMTAWAGQIDPDFSCV